VIALLAQGDPPYYQVRRCHISQVPAGRSLSGQAHPQPEM